MRDGWTWTGAAVAVLLMGSLPAAAQPQGMPPKQVGVVQVSRQDVPRIITLPGRAVAAAAAAIRPRVGGIVTEILYQPGRPIAAGDPMFRIEATTYEANLASAEAQLASARAQLTQAEAAFRRTEQLLGSGSTQAQVETARASFEQAQASVEAADAARRLSEAELGWTTITSPIAGIASIAEVSVGDLVTAGQATELARVTQLDPIEVDMYEPSSRFLSVLDDINAGRLQLNDELRATLTLENGQVYEAVLRRAVERGELHPSVQGRIPLVVQVVLALPGLECARGGVGPGRAFAVSVVDAVVLPALGAHARPGGPSPTGRLQRGFDREGRALSSGRRFGISWPAWVRRSTASGP